MHRSELTIDLGAVRRNARTLLRALDGAQLWAVVKADAYGHGAVDVAAAVLDEGAGALCVATVPEALELRSEFSLARILVTWAVARSGEGRARTCRIRCASGSSLARAPMRISWAGPPLPVVRSVDADMALTTKVVGKAGSPSHKANH